MRWEFSVARKVKIIFVCRQQKAENNLRNLVHRGMLEVSEAVWGVL